MKFKNLLLLITLFCILFQCSLKAQRREDVTVIKFDSVSKKMEHIQQWYLNPTSGKWDTSWVFKSVNWVKFKYKNESYKGLIYQKLMGFYKYPVLKLDFYKAPVIFYMIFKEENVKELQGKLAMKSGKNVSLRSWIHGTFSGDYLSNDSEDKQILYKSITDKLEDSKVFRYDKIFIMNAQILDGKEIVRFDEPMDISTSKFALKNGYFEVPYSDFIAAFETSETKFIN